MVLPSSFRLKVKLCRWRGRILCRVPLSLPGHATGFPTRELVLVASPTAPYLRRVVLYRRFEQSRPDPPPLAA